MNSKKNYFAVIDIGSNSMRLVIYSNQHSGRLQEVENMKAVVRLKNYIDHENILSDEGISHIIRTLKSFKDILFNYELTEFKVIATAAIRQAVNQKEIQQIVKEQFDWEMRVLSEDEEAFYGYLAVVNSTAINEGITVDIGGGSTEVTYFKNRILIHSHSFSFGALKLKQFFDNNNSPMKNIQDLRRFLHQAFYSIGWLADKHVPLIGMGGFARSMAEIDQNMKRYPLTGLHQYGMIDNDIAQLIRYLASLSSDERVKVDGLSSDRADTILPAIILFHTLYLAINSDMFILSRKGIRDGVSYEALSGHSNIDFYPDVLEDSLTELISDYNLDPSHIEHTNKLAKNLFNSFRTHEIGSFTPKDGELLHLACHVYDLGRYIDVESSSQHTFYLLSNRTIDGLMHLDRLKLALIASYNNKTSFKEYIRPYKQWFIKEERNKLALLGAMLKLTYSLDHTKRQTVQYIKLTIQKDQTINLTCYCDKDFLPEQQQVEKQKKHIEKLLERNIKLLFVMQNNNRF